MNRDEALMLPPWWLAVAAKRPVGPRDASSRSRPRDTSRPAAARTSGPIAPISSTELVCLEPLRNDGEQFVNQFLLRDLAHRPSFGEHHAFSAVSYTHLRAHETDSYL